MSKYHVFKDSDFNNLDDADHEPITSSIGNSNKAIAFSDDEENFDLSYEQDSHRTNNDQLRNERSLQPYNHQHKDLVYDNDDHSYNNGTLFTTDSKIEKLIQCNDKKVSVSNRRNMYNNSNTSANNSMTPLDSSDAAATEDYTMEIPLLQQNYSNSSNMDRSNNCNNNKLEQHCDRACVCLLQQKGFASNLNTSSTRSAKSKIIWAIAVCCIFMVVEFLGGYLAGSLAIMTDAAHLASDCISFVIGLVAIWLGNKPPDTKMSFGYKRFEVMGAIVSILAIWILTATLVLVAIQRIVSNDYDLDASAMMTISGIGILINIIMIFILHTSVLDLPAGIGSSHGHSHSHNHSDHHGHTSSNSHSPIFQRHHSNDSGHLPFESTTRSLLPTHTDEDAIVAFTATDATDATDSGRATSIELSSEPMMLNGNMLKHQQDGNEKNINLRAAMIHVIGDLVQSFGVFLAAVLIKIFPNAVFLDPLCTLLFSVIVIMTTINLFKESMHLIMDSVPQGLSIHDLRMDLLNIEGVKSVHHLNVWNYTSNNSILMVHLIIDIRTDSNTVLFKATKLAGSPKYNIKHSTIQVERTTL